MRGRRDLRHTPHAGAYEVVFGDPAWKFRTYSDRGLAKSPAAHYPVSPTKLMGELPVAEVAAADAWLILWGTWPHLVAGDVHRLVEAWSDPANPWMPCTGGAWAKRPRGWKGDPTKWAFGTGYILRSASEPLLIWRRGNPAWKSKSERGLWEAPVRRHSEKPDEVRDAIVRCTDGPRLEMFSRLRSTAEFDAWGWGAKR